jgi:putative DNA primase/helicase
MLSQRTQQELRGINPNSMPQKIWISVGKSKREINWKNVELTWEQFVAKLRAPIITKEILAEYLKLPKDEQALIKDVGGFVGGPISGGRRKLNSVTSRYLLTLETDNAPQAFWEDVCLTLNCQMVLYSTHKHSASEGHYRLVIPLEREVLVDEHEAIARKVAELINIELFDPTTFQPTRLMYWPSVSRDAQYILKEQDGDWLDPDQVLASYADWQDTSQWAYSEASVKKVKDAIAKQADPLDKDNLVGTFCRVYGISEAIEKYLSDVYEPTQHEDRYTYKQGSTHAGVIIYDNKYSFSHHSTDPTQGRLCNSFDLVRIHLFGDSDDRVEPDTPLAKKPSYGKMIDLLVNDGLVKQSIVQERVDRRKNKTDVVEGDWMTQLEMDKRGSITNTINNVVTILNNDEALKDRLSYDDLRKCPIVSQDLPWRTATRFSRLWVDSDDAELRNYLETLYGITNRDKIKDAVEIVTRQNKFHPVKDYLKTQQWDGKKRVETLLHVYLGSADTAYVREVTRKTLVAAVARIFEPGCKFDYVLTLVGPQGIGKSRLISKLAGEWYSDTFGSLQNKDAMENIQGVWIMEIGELAGFKKQEIETIKLFVAKQEDRFRIAYARRVEPFPRQCIFIGTTNNMEFLQDPTGNRRFWPILCGVEPGWQRRQLDMSNEERAQIWAEACVMYAEGEDLYLNEEVEIEAKGVQAEFTETDSWEGMIGRYIESKVPKNWYEMSVYDRRMFFSGDESVGLPEILRDYITIPEIWCELFGGTMKDANQYAKRIRNIMNKQTGWEKQLINRKPYGTQRGWVRVSSKTAKQQHGEETLL